MIKAIIFDYGNVIHRWDNDVFLKKIVKKSDKSYEYIDELIFGKSGLQHKFELGKISSEDFFNSVKKECNLSTSKDEFFNDFVSRMFRIIQPTITLIKKLKKNYKIGLLSDTSKVDFDYRMKELKEISLFDSITLSFELGHKKPEKQIYLDALKKLNLRPEECVYIDDIKEYSDAASNIGMHGIQYTSHENLVKELKKLKIEI